MKFSTETVIRGNPKFTLRAKPGPFTIEAGAQGAVTIACHGLDARVGRVPIVMRIPFLKRTRSIQISAVGPFAFHIQPMEMEFRLHGVQLAAVLAKDGMDCEVTGNVDCDMTVHLSGVIPGRLAKASIEMAAEPGEEE